MMNRTMLWCALFFMSGQLTAAVSLDPTPYQLPARIWVEEHAVSLSAQDLQYIANLFYFSFLRSAATIVAQEAAIPALKATWHGWQNIAQTRMNPSRALPYDQNYQNQKQTYEFFLHAQELHHTVGKTYAHATQTILKKSVLSSPALTAVEEIRAQARIIVMQSFLDIKKILGASYHFAAEHMRHSEELFTAQEEDEINRWDFLDTCIAHIPKLAYQSFIESENIHKHASEKSWDITYTISDVSAQVWTAIEHARGSYYMAYYQELIKYMYAIGSDTRYMLITFNQDGLISASEQDEELQIIKH